MKTICYFFKWASVFVIVCALADVHKLDIAASGVLGALTLKAEYKDKK